MGYSNPFMNMPIPNMAPNYTAPTPKIDPAQFRQFAMTLNDNSLSQLAQMARQRGISDADIQAGINFIKSL
jgi:hypothetical protein